MEHGANDLRQLQMMPLEYKIMMTQERIKAWYESWTQFVIEDLETGKIRYETIDTRDFMAEPKLKESEWIKSAYPGQVYVSFSGGKDSTVLKHIVDSMYDDVPAVFVNTGLEYPEIQKFVKDVKAGKWDCFNTDVEIIRPEMRFDEVIKKYGYPVIGKEVSGAVFDARVQARNSGKDVRSTSLWNRVFNPESEKNKKYPGFSKAKYDYPMSQPMAFWTKQDVLHYIKKYDVPYCSVYGEIVADTDPDFDGQINMIDYLGDYEPGDKLKTTGCDRTGCIFCMFGCHLEKEPNRFQRLKETHPRQYEYCINGGEMVDGKWQPSKEGLGLGKVLDYIGVNY